MTFFERYEKLCLASGYKPGSEQAAQILGTNRGTISAWKKSGNPPTPDILVRIADVYGVSTDYLLGRTDDPRDFSNEEIKNAAAYSEAVAENETHREATPKGVQLYRQLDEIDKGKAEGYMQGLLSQDKYSAPPSRKKHA